MLKAQSKELSELVQATEVGTLKADAYLAARTRLAVAAPLAAWILGREANGYDLGVRACGRATPSLRRAWPCWGQA